MPTFEIDELALAANTPDFAKVVHSIESFMFYPEDKSARDTYTNSVLSSRLKDINRELGFRAFEIVIDLNRPDIETRSPEKLLDETLPHVVGGRASDPDAPKFVAPRIAAEILHEAIEQHGMAKSGKGVSLRDCLSSISKKLGAMGSVKGAHPDDLNKVWNAYRRSAPLTLAYRNMSMVFGEHAFMLDPANVVVLCQMCNAYIYEGERIRHRNAEHPILPPGECWKMVILPRARLRRTPPQKIP